MKLQIVSTKVVQPFCTSYIWVMVANHIIPPSISACSVNPHGRNPYSHAQEPCTAGGDKIFFQRRSHAKADQTVSQISC